MIIKTKLSSAIYNFLNKNLIVNLNLIGFMENEPDCEIYVDNDEAPTGVIARKDYFSYLYVENDDFLNEALDTLYRDGFYGFSGVYRPIAEKIKKRFPVGWESRCYLYYYPKKEVDLSLVKNPVKTVQMEDAETINHYYTYRDETSLQRIKTDLLNRPSSAVYIDGDIASWVLVHTDNSMGIMFTKDEYRGRGYAVDVTVDLTDKILKSGKTPFLQIVESNNMSPGLARKCGFVHEGDFSDWLGIIAGTPREIIDMHEECEKKFLESLGDAVKFFSRDTNQKIDKMFATSGNINDKFAIPEGFEIKAVEDKDKKLLWCETLADGLNIRTDERKEFIEKILSVITKEKYEYRLILGMIDGKPVSTAAFLRLNEDVCGLYFNSVKSETERDAIKRAALIKSIKKIEDYQMYLIFAQSPEEHSEFYKEIGFVHSHYKNGDTLEK